MDSWVVLALSMGRSPASAYLEPVPSWEIESIIVEDFDNNIG